MRQIEACGSAKADVVALGANYGGPYLSFHNQHEQGLVLYFAICGPCCIMATWQSVQEFTLSEMGAISLLCTTEYCL